MFARTSSVGIGVLLAILPLLCYTVAVRKTGCM
jgi:hypothetical protein